MQKTETVAVIGLGYVGLPLALALAEHYDVIGVDSDSERLDALRRGIDRTGEVPAARLSPPRLTYASSAQEAARATAFIVTAPTPVFADNRPNLTLLERAACEVGAVLQKGGMVVFESTVCPGTTEDFCLPILERESGLRVNADFDCAYSPERISPNEKGLSDAVKIVSAASPEGLARVAALYRRVVPAGLYEAPSIKTAEAAKLVENVQRDVDIALFNELAMLCAQMGLDSRAVFDAAATKWNFRRFHPGLVGGHCIGTDSYYLLEHAEQQGMPAEVLRAARQVNNAVPQFVADNALRLLRERGKTAAVAPPQVAPPQAAAEVMLFGFSFKENCADVRRTLVEPLRRALLAGGCRVRVCDPVADAKKALTEYGVQIETDIDAALAAPSDLLLFAVAHRQFAAIPESALAGRLVVDVKGVAARADWRL